MPKGEGQLGRVRGPYKPREPLSAVECRRCNALRARVKRDALAAIKHMASPDPSYEHDADRLADAILGLAQLAVRRAHRRELGKALSADSEHFASVLRGDIRSFAVRLAMGDGSDLIAGAEAVVAAEGPPP